MKVASVFTFLAAFDTNIIIYIAISLTVLHAVSNIIALEKLFTLINLFRIVFSRGVIKVIRFYSNVGCRYLNVAFS